MPDNAMPILCIIQRIIYQQLVIKGRLQNISVDMLPQDFDE